jgi:hypothetical protein
MYTSSININQTYATGTGRLSTYTSNKLQVHIISQHKIHKTYDWFMLADDVCL